MRGTSLVEVSPLRRTADQGMDILDEKSLIPAAP
jgi:hypothetical protein